MRSAIALILASFALLGSATMSQGLLEYTRDYGIEYKTSAYASNEDFCKDLRAKCVTYAGTLDEHHQIDCVFDQSTTLVRAWCGGIAKNANGSWTVGEAQVDHTRPAMALLGKKAKIVAKPMTYKKCLAAKVHNAAVVCVA